MDNATIRRQVLRQATVLRKVENSSLAWSYSNSRSVGHHECEVLRSHEQNVVQHWLGTLVAMDSVVNGERARI